MGDDAELCVIIWRVPCCWELFAESPNGVSRGGRYLESPYHRSIPNNSLPDESCIRPHNRLLDGVHLNNPWLIRNCSWSGSLCFKPPRQLLGLATFVRDLSHGLWNGLHCCIHLQMDPVNFSL